jgi:hypothetical protein
MLCNKTSNKEEMEELVVSRNRSNRCSRRRFKILEPTADSTTWTILPPWERTRLIKAQTLRSHLLLLNSLFSRPTVRFNNMVGPRSHPFGFSSYPAGHLAVAQWQCANFLYYAKKAARMARVDEEWGSDNINKWEDWYPTTWRDGKVG